MVEFLNSPCKVGVQEDFGVSSAMRSGACAVFREARCSPLFSLREELLHVPSPLLCFFYQYVLHICVFLDRLISFNMVLHGITIF